MSQGKIESKGQIIQTDEGQIRGHLDEVVRSTVEITLNALLDEEVARVDS